MPTQTLVLICHSVKFSHFVVFNSLKHFFRISELCFVPMIWITAGLFSLFLSKVQMDRAEKWHKHKKMRCAKFEPIRGNFSASARKGKFEYFESCYASTFSAPALQLYCLKFC